MMRKLNQPQIVDSSWLQALNAMKKMLCDSIIQNLVMLLETPITQIEGLSCQLIVVACLALWPSSIKALP